MKKCGILIVVYLLVFATTSFAEIIYLKNGTKVTGEIYGQTSYSIKVKVNGVPYTYYMNEIEKIEQEEKEELTVKGPDGNEIPTFATNAKKEELILRLFEANGVSDTMKDRFEEIIAGYSSEQQAEVRKVFQADEIIAALVPIYAKYYTENEIKELITFYRSPTGAKHLGLTPKLVEESMHAAIEYFQNKVPGTDLDIKIPK